MNKLTLTLGMCLLTFAAQAEIYKSVGSDGTVQYSSTPPAGRPYESIEKAPAPRNYDPTVLENARRQLQEASEKAQEQQARRDLEAKDKQVAGKMAENCKVARENFENLEAHSGILREDAETGVVVRLTYEERQAQMDKAKKDMDYFCDGYSINASSQ
jgi:hypothetical protein